MSEVIKILRAFQLWRYEVSHSMLWLMSSRTPTGGKGGGHDTRLSIVFKAVTDLCLPSLMFIESIEFEGRADDVRRYSIHGHELEYDSTKGEFVRRSVDAGPERYVTAFAHFLYEDALEHSASIPPFSKIDGGECR